MRIPVSLSISPQQSAAARSVKRRRAAAAVEFAVVALPFFIIILGLIELGRGFMVQHLLLAAARQGARVGIVPSNGNTEISTAVGNVMTPAGITSDHITVTVNDGVADA